MTQPKSGFRRPSTSVIDGAAADLGLLLVDLGKLDKAVLPRKNGEAFELTTSFWITLQRCRKTQRLTVRRPRG
jgi:hypothetical protein